MTDESPPRAAGLAALLPGFLVGERRGPLTSADEAGLFPAERHAIARAVPQRRREYATVRRLAREQLAILGIESAPILSSERGAPRWPDGVVGSMTHCDGLCAAAVTTDSYVRAAGIDAEPDAPLPGGVLAMITSPAERHHLRMLRQARRQVNWERVLFSAKETTYKVWFPLNRTWLDFGDVDVVIGHDGRFRSSLVGGPLMSSTGPSIMTVPGRWACEDGLVLTAAMV